MSSEIFIQLVKRAETELQLYKCEGSKVPSALPGRQKNKQRFLAEKSYLNTSTPQPATAVKKRGPRSRAGLMG